MYIIVWWILEPHPKFYAFIYLQEYQWSTDTITSQIIQLDISYIKVRGEIKDVLIIFFVDPRVCQFIDIMVVDIPEAYGLVLRRDWSMKLNGYFSTDWSHLWFPYNNN